MSSGAGADGIGDGDLEQVLVEAQRLGFLGQRPIGEVIEHARSFVSALDGVNAPDGRVRVVDLGAGGGVPGLVIAADRPDIDLVLVDRRSKRTDVLQRAVRRLGWDARVAVRCMDVATMAAQMPGHFDAAVARGFGPPELTLSWATRLVRPGGRIVISEPPAGDRWSRELLDQLDLVHRDERSATGRVAIFERRA